MRMENRATEVVGQRDDDGGGDNGDEENKIMQIQ